MLKLKRSLRTVFLGLIALSLSLAVLANFVNSSISVSQAAAIVPDCARCDVLSKSIMIRVNQTQSPRTNLRYVCSTYTALISTPAVLLTGGLRPNPVVPLYFREQ